MAIVKRRPTIEEAVEFLATIRASRGEAETLLVSGFEDETGSWIVVEGADGETIETFSTDEDEHEE